MQNELTGIQARRGDMLLMIGTTKGGFLLRASSRRDQWQMDGPHFAGEEMYAFALDQRGGRRTLWAAPSSPFWGTTLRCSVDLGKSWNDREAITLRFPEESGLALKRVWQITPGLESEPNRLFLGVEPSCLFESGDGGATWAPVEAYLNHEHRPQWSPGNGGLCLHTILLDPERGDRLLAAQSTGGVYRTDDGGRSWAPRNRGVRVDFMPEKYPEFGQCVHKVVHHDARPERLYLQNHGGLYRSDDWGDHWTDIANGVPSDFGFAMAIHPVDPETVYILPLDSEGRWPVDARLQVYRTRNGGGSWEGLGRGLPQEDAYETTLRDGMATDTLDPAGIYFGTRSGKVYGSSDEGETWALIRDGLPPVVCVKSAVIA